MLLIVYRSLLYLYPESYRDEFGEEMTSVFREARTDLSPGLTAKITFHQREFRGLLSGALRAHFERLFRPGIPFQRFDINASFVFPLNRVFDVRDLGGRGASNQQSRKYRSAEGRPPSRNNRILGSHAGGNAAYARVCPGGCHRGMGRLFRHRAHWHAPPGECANPARAAVEPAH
jgi:hypothetical protein